MRRRLVTGVIFANLLLLSIVIFTISKWRNCREIENDEVKTNADNFLKNDAHFYISSAYQLTQGIETNTTRLIVMAPQNQENFKLQCRDQNGVSVKANIQSLSNVKNCKWWSYSIDCKFNKPISNLFLTVKRGKSVEVPIKKPSLQEHNVVVCFARMFLFENWRIALANIELYRAHGVDMFNIPIISVIESLYNILKAYEKMGIVKLTDGVILPKINEDFDPNEETEYFNQVISNTECLYNFKNSKFIIFSDFDDTIVPRNYYNLYQELSAISAQYPLASSFEFLRDPNTKIKFAKDPQKFDLDDSISHIELVDLKVSPGKTAVIPSRIKGGLIHKPSQSDIIKGYKHIQLNESYAYFLHLYAFYDDQMEVKNPTYVNKVKYPSLQRSLFDLLNSDDEAKKSFLNLPIENYYYNEMVKCHGIIGKKLSDNEVFCPNALHCQPKIDKTNNTAPKCARLNVNYKSVKIGRKITIHQPSSTQILTDTYCQI